MKPPEDNDYKKKLSRVNLNFMSRNNLPIPDHAETIMELAAAGELILQAEAKNPRKAAPPTAKLPDETTKLETKLGSMSDDPYVKARVEILNGMGEFERKEIERMEKTNDLNNRWYEDFCHKVRVLADWKYPENK